MENKYKKWANRWFPNTTLTAEIVLQAMINAKKDLDWPEEPNQTPEAINNGLCDYVAEEAVKRLPGAKFESIDDYPKEWKNYEFPETNGHAWFKYKGKYYDAEAPNGVKDWRDLPFMKRAFIKESLIEKILKEADENSLTEDEKKILDYLTEAYNLFVSLPNNHPSDNEEFTKNIHILQRQVMSRLARRVHPEIFG